MTTLTVRKLMEICKDLDSDSVIILNTDGLYYPASTDVFTSQEKNNSTGEVIRKALILIKDE